MKTILFVTLLKQRHQYLFQLLVISIFMFIFNLNDLSYCAGIESESRIM
jgi:hypothetical protein